MIFNCPFEYDVIETFVRAHEELRRSLFILYVHERDRLNFGMLSVETAVFQIAFVDLVPVTTEKVSPIRSNII